MNLKEITCKCPHCGDTFKLGDALEENAVEEVRAELVSINDEEFQQRLEEENRKALEAGKKEAREELLEQSKETVEELANANAALAEQELQKIKTEAEVRMLKEHQQTTIKVEIAKQKNQWETEKSTEVTGLKLKNEQLKRDLERASERANQGSMQLQGETSELVIEDTLERVFPGDEVLPVAKGKRGADCFLNVKNNAGRTVGKILVESKHTKKFSPEWIKKLKKDMVNGGAGVGVLVTAAWPSGTRNEERTAHLKDGVWICGFHEYTILVRALRQGLFEVARTTAAEEAREGKAQVMFDFLTSQEFAHTFEQIFEPIFRMREQLDKEKSAMQRIWKERETLIDCSIGGADALYMKIQGIAQVNLPPIKGMEALEDLTGP